MTRYDCVYVTNGGPRLDRLPCHCDTAILADIQEIDVSDCMERAKKSLIQYLGNVILAFQAFKAGEPDAVVKDFLGTSCEQIRVFLIELDAVKNAH